MAFHVRVWYFKISSSWQTWLGQRLKAKERGGGKLNGVAGAHALVLPL